MEKVVRFLKGKTCIVLMALCVLTFAACKLPYTLQNARFKKEFLWVYAEKDFNFKTAGMGKELSHCLKTLNIMECVLL